MSLMLYQVGDVVRTVDDDGPKMTVSFLHDVQTVTCLWFDKNDVLHKSVFSIDTIKVVE